LTAAAHALAEAVRRGRLGRVTLQRVDGDAALATDGTVRAALEEAGFFAHPRGLRLRERDRSTPTGREGARAGG